MLSLVVVAGCSEAGPSVVLKGQRFQVEVADAPAEQQRGLMFVTNMPEYQGMLFVFPREAPRSFWMKNCRIPLDILYFDSGLQLVSAQLNVPPCRAEPCASYPSAGPARYVLELNAGMAQRLGVNQGDALELALTP
ncbi:MAG: DUF192 domain-containing protein [Lysobacterales bacterium]